MSEELPDEGVEPVEIEQDIPEAEVEDEVEVPEEGIEEDDDSDEDESPAPIAKQGQSEKSGMVARVKRERKEAIRKAEMAEERARLLELQMQQINQMRYQQPPVEENLDPDEKWRRDANAAIQRSQFQMQDMLDKNTYDVKALTSPVYKKWEAKVEKALRDARQNNQNPTRENILKFLLGEAALGNIKAPTTPVKKTAARVAASKVTTPGARSTVTPGKKETSLRDKLKDARL